jgi:hypothetical protein
MTTTINDRGCSVCNPGEENYITFNPAGRRNRTLYQYDYRTASGELFSGVFQSLEACREARDKWLKGKRS